MIRTESKRDRAGVTLIEAVLVITLLAAASATSLILMDNQWLARRHVITTANEVADTLVTARNTAITNQATLTVRRVRSGGLEQLLITEQPGPYRSGNTWQVDLGEDVRLRGAPVQIRFNPTGSANRSLTWTITSSQSNAQVTVSPASGQVLRHLP